MSLLNRLRPGLWIVALVAAAGWLLWTDGARAKHVEVITALGGATVTEDPASPTGYAGGVRMLLSPGHNNESYQWIAQAQTMLAEGQWRVRRVEYDNAPTGRAVTSPSPYRWWLAAVAWCDHRLSGRSPGLAVERAALWADPVLHLLMLVGAAVFTARRFGSLAALGLILGIAAVFPATGAFQPGSPGEAGLILATLLVMLLTLLAGVQATGDSRRWFIGSGVCGGLGLWLSVNTFVPILGGLALGGLGATWLNRRRGNPNAVLAAPPWRAWSIGGAVATIAAFLLEYAPGHFDFPALRLHQVHPLYAVAWLGLGELLARATLRLQGGRWATGRGGLGLIALAVIGVAAIPVLMVSKNLPAFLSIPAYADQLSGAADGIKAANLAKWIVQDGPTLPLAATCLPLLLVVAALWQAGRKDGNGPALVLLLGPVTVAFVFACAQLSWWNQLDVLLVVLLVAGLATPGLADRTAWRWLGGSALLLLPGALALWPPQADGDEPAVTRMELEGLVERDFAHWLARRTGADGAIVLAPPNLTASLYFHGGLRGLGSPYAENEEGFRASVRLAGATSADEAQALARQRKLTHIAIPSWDGFLDEYARLGADQPEHTLMGLLHTWLPPRWLRPVPYYLPNLKAFEAERLLLFELTDVQDHASSLSRLTEYFVDMGQPELATIAARTLAAEYSADLGAQVAKARTEIARRDRANLTQSLAAITSALQDGSGDSLAWDRRVSLCLVLAAGNQMAPAREQAQRCLEEMGELDLRSLSESTLFRFLGLCKALGLRLEDASLQEQAKALLPPALRSQI